MAQANRRIIDPLVLMNTSAALNISAEYLRCALRQSGCANCVRQTTFERLVHVTRRIHCLNSLCDVARSATASFESVWNEASAQRGQGVHNLHDSTLQWWSRLTSANASLVTRPLSSDSCHSPHTCIGVAAVSVEGERRCVCYT